MASEAETTAAKGEMGKVYKITKSLCKKNSCSVSNVKNKQGVVLTSEKDQAERLVEHFKEVLNHPYPDLTANIEPAETPLDLDLDPPNVNEVRKAILTLKSGKAPGIDQIYSEMLKADLTTSTTVLTSLFTSIWNNEYKPDDCAKGLIVKLPKKGDLQA